MIVKIIQVLKKRMEAKIENIKEMFTKTYNNQGTNKDE